VSAGRSLQIETTLSIYYHALLLVGAVQTWEEHWEALGCKLTRYMQQPELEVLLGEEGAQSAFNLLLDLEEDLQVSHAAHTLHARPACVHALAKHHYAYHAVIQRNRACCTAPLTVIVTAVQSATQVITA
jgi:hypothetical protein